MNDITRQCVILVGGLGSRLGALTADCPKPLLEVSGKPFVAHLIENARRFGFDRFILLAGYKAEAVEEFAASFRRAAGLSIEVCREDSPAGTAGALLGARHLLDDEFLMLNGDSLFDFNLLDLASTPGGCDWEGRISLRRVANTHRYGRIEVEGTRITAAQEKTGVASAGLINGGVYWLRKSVLDWIVSVPASLERDIFPALVNKGLLHGYEYSGPFIDIGIPEDLEFARARWREFLTRPAIFFDRDGVLNHDDGYTHKREDFRWIEGAKNAIRRANDEGKYVFVVTNQAGIARGYYEAAAVNVLHCWMNEDLRRDGAHIDDFRFCPHHPGGSIKSLSIACDCRKPEPGMILSLMDEWPVDRSRSLLIGDKQSDLDAARAAGLRGIMFDGSKQVDEAIDQSAS